MQLKATNSDLISDRNFKKCQPVGIGAGEKESSQIRILRTVRAKNTTGQSSFCVTPDRGMIVSGGGYDGLKSIKSVKTIVHNWQIENALARNEAIKMLIIEVAEVKTEVGEVKIQLDHFHR